jgi:hypothetical protein
MALGLGLKTIARLTRPPGFSTWWWDDEMFHVRPSAVAPLFERLQLIPVGRGGVWLVLGARVSVIRNPLLQAKDIHDAGCDLMSLANEADRSRAHFETRAEFDRWAADFCERAPAIVRNLALARGQEVLDATAELRGTADRVFDEVVSPVLGEPDPAAHLRERLDAETLAMAGRLSRDVLLRGAPSTRSLLEIALLALLVGRDEVALRGDRVVNLGLRKFGGYAPLELGQRVRVLANLIDTRLRPDPS